LDSKDYYKILELPPSATLKEIKAAYRKLAHQYHPDKSDNLYSLAQFNLVKEAYEVLTDPSRKEYYLQQRWYEQSINKKGSTEAATPVSILRKTLDLEKRLALIDVYRMNAEEVVIQINEVLSDEHIDILNGFNEQEINTVIVRHLTRNVQILPLHMARQLTERLRKINVDEESVAMINASESNAVKNQRMERLHPWLILLVVIFLCVLIYVVSN
jgi:hypothetical protein